MYHKIIYVKIKDSCAITKSKHTICQEGFHGYIKGYPFIMNIRNYIL